MRIIKEDMESSLSAIFHQISKVSLYFAFFLIPLFFLPFAQDVLDYPKQILLVFLVFLSLITWLLGQFTQRKLIVKENRVLYSILLLILFFFSLSTIFSLWPTASLWGWSFSIADNFLTFFSLLLLVFLFVNTLQTEMEIFFPIFLLLISGVIAGLFLLFQVYGIFILPFDFAQTSSFNTIGSVYQATIFLAGLLPLSLVLAFQIRKQIFWIILLILSGTIILINLKMAWIILLLGLFPLAIFGLQGRMSIGQAAFLMVLLVVSIFFLFFPLRFPGFPALPLQVTPGLVSEVGILKDLYAGGIKNILFGSGPGTFIFDYSKYRSALLNQTLFWGTRFSSGSSEFLDWFITKGLLGGISLLSFLCFIIYFGIKSLITIKNPFGMRLAFFASAISLIGAGFLSPFNFSLLFLFWVIIAGLLFYNLKETEIHLRSRPRKLVSSIVIVAVTILGLFLFFSQGRKYLAEINYSQGIKFSQQGDIDRAINLTKKATLFNPSNDIYWRDLAQLYLAKANLIAQTDTYTAEQRRQFIQDNIANGIQSINQAIGLAPFNVANWNVRGFFYRNLIGVPGAGEVAIESYRRATELEPASPFPYGEMGRTYILMAQDFRAKQMPDKERESLSSAISSLEKSIELKSDYAPAHYLIAVAYDQQGRKDEAIARLEKTKNIIPNDIGISFQLGMLYWRKEELDLAQSEFERIIELNPDYSNARYMLGLVYDKKGEREKAKEQFERVAQLNSENQEVKKILENLTSGLPALEGIIPSQPPIGENPPEIQGK